MGVAKTLFRSTPDMSAWREFCASQQGPRARCFSKQPLKTCDSIPSCVHPITPPPKNKVQSWENNCPTTPGTNNSCVYLTLPNGARFRNGHWLLSFAKIGTFLPSSHRLGKIKTYGGSCVRLKAQLLVSLCQWHYMLQEIQVILNVQYVPGLQHP